MSPRSKRFKLLLDENLPRREMFPQLNKLHDVKHIFDYKKGGTSDDDVVKLAKKEKRILVSRNEKHMYKPCTKEKVFLICPTENIPNGEIDDKINAKLKNWDPDTKIIRLKKSPRKK